MYDSDYSDEDEMYSEGNKVIKINPYSEALSIEPLRLRWNESRIF